MTNLSFSPTRGTVGRNTENTITTGVALEFPLAPFPVHVLSIYTSVVLLCLVAFSSCSLVSIVRPSLSGSLFVG